MGTITLKNLRTNADVKMNAGLKDGGISIDWATLTDIKAWLWSDAQKAMAGRCDVRVDAEDSTKLICEYAKTKAQYPGVNRLIIQATYMGATKTYDKPAFNFVRWTAEQSGTQITLDDPEVDVDIEVQDVTSSILQEAIAAALAAAADAEHAAHLIPNQVLLDCESATAAALNAASKAPYIGANGNWWVWSPTDGEYIDSEQVARGPRGNGITSWSVVESQEDDGENVITVVFTDGEEETFSVKNGKTGNGISSIVQTVESPDDAGTNVITITMTNGTVVTFNVKNGSKGQPGAAQAAYKSVAELPAASAATMDKIYLTPSGTSGVYNMSYTDYDGSAYSWVDMGTTAIQLSDYATKEEFSLLQEKVNDAYDEVDLTKQIARYYIITPSTLKWSTTNTRYHFSIPAGIFQKVKVTANSSAVTRVAFLVSDPTNIYDSSGSGTDADLVEAATYEIAAGTTLVKDIPSGTKYIYILLASVSENTYSSMPDYVGLGISTKPGTIDTDTRDAVVSTSNIKNLIDTLSGGYYVDLANEQQYDGTISFSTGKWSVNGTISKHLRISVKPGQRIRFSSSKSCATTIAQLYSTPSSYSSGQFAPVVDGTLLNPLGNTITEFDVAKGAVCLAVNLGSDHNLGLGSGMPFSVYIFSPNRCTQPHTDTEYKSAFMAKVNAKATFIGLESSNFPEVSGYETTDSYSTPKDVIKILVHCSGMQKIAEKWNKKSYSIAVGGQNPRTVSITSTVQDVNYTYFILGGKTGTKNSVYNLAWVTRVNNENYACCLMNSTSDSNRWADAKAIADYLAVQSGTLTVVASGVAAASLPDNPIMFDGFDFPFLVEKNKTTQVVPASITKLMSLITAYDYILDENESIIIKDSDIISSSTNLNAGDVVTIRDLVYDMLLASSNTAATALSRVIGKKIMGE